jgi:hypothetical protein
MKNTKTNTLSTLKRELEFLDKGGYQTPAGSRQPLFCMEAPIVWSQPLFFEDSPSCPKKKYLACNPEGDCVLMNLVPVEHRHETIPCRHIPLNENGETVESLYRSGTNKEIEAALRNWLVREIKKTEATVGKAEFANEEIAQ